LIDLGNDHSAVLRVDRHVPAAARPLVEVRADVDKRVLDERMAAQGKRDAQALLARVQKGMTLDAAAATVGASVLKASVERNATNVPAPLLAKAFVLPHPVADKPVYASVDLNDGSHALLALDKVQAGDLAQVTAEQREVLRQQMAQAYAAEATREMLSELRGKVKIKYNKTLM
jgi:peptidyl-prolyl cis-trans isomerase D